MIAAVNLAIREKEKQARQRGEDGDDDEEEDGYSDDNFEGEERDGENKDSQGWDDIIAPKQATGLDRRKAGRRSKQPAVAPTPEQTLTGMERTMYQREVDTADLKALLAALRSKSSVALALLDEAHLAIGRQLQKEFQGANVAAFGKRREEEHALRERLNKRTQGELSDRALHFLKMDFDSFTQAREKSLQRTGTVGYTREERVVEMIRAHDKEFR